MKWKIWRDIKAHKEEYFKNEKNWRYEKIGKKVFIAIFFWKIVVSPHQSYMKKKDIVGEENMKYKTFQYSIGQLVIVPYIRVQWSIAQSTSVKFSFV